jgi:hypothetical protein
MNLSSQILVVISSGDAEKALTGMMYAYNAMNYGWMDKVKVVFFGPAEKLLSDNPGIQNMARQIVEATQDGDKELAPTACKFISDRDDTSNAIASLGIHVEYVGKLISDFIKDGYTPLVF